ncbi:MAG: MotA/TolQ/ExbB proton channel family protein [Geminicoccaceae bacterium]
MNTVAAPNVSTLRVATAAEPDANASPLDTDSRWHFLLLLRFIIINATGCALLAAAYLQGWVEVVAVADQTHLVAVIALVFAAGLGWSARRAWQLSRELNEARETLPASWSKMARYHRDIKGTDAQARATLASALKLKLSNRISTVKHMASSLVLLGLIGTVVGFIIALSGVDPDVASDVGAVGTMVSTLIGGMSIALHTTLVGAILNVWLMMNYRLLESGSVKLLTAIVERGERHARS